jgi:3-oxoacyl-[acyl-carrier protein] reductase
MDLGLKDKIALVTAASRGLGAATALQLSREGAKVAICSRSQANIEQAAASIQAETGNQVLGLVADMGEPDDIERLVGAVVEAFGGLDILVTNAGGPPAARFEEIDAETWEEWVNIELLSVVRLIHAALPHLRKSQAPAVLTMTSYSVKQPIPNLVLSNSIRLAVIGLTKTLALELGGEGIRFNSILPAWTRTERVVELMEDRARRAGTSVEEEIQKQSAASPAGRMAEPHEFANVATFLVSPAASYVTGAMLPVDGGMYKGTL